MSKERAEQQARPLSSNLQKNNTGVCRSGLPSESMAGPNSTPAQHNTYTNAKQVAECSSEQPRVTKVGSYSSDLVRRRPPLAHESRTSATTLPPPNSSKKRKRKKRFPQEGGETATQKDLGGTDRPSVTGKRDRLDDTVSPRGDAKRTRTVDGARETGSMSYARAAQQPNLGVAIALSPRGLLTLDESENIKNSISKKIFAALTDPIRPGQTRYAPAFRGNSFLSRGVLMMWCEEDKALEWLKAAVRVMPSPRAGTTLTVVRQSDLPDLVKAVLFVPDYTGDVGILQSILALQNYWYNMQSWSLYHASVRTHNYDSGDKTGLYLVLGIPRNEVLKVQEHERRVAYMVGSIYLRYVTPKGLSNDPPPERDKEEMCVGGEGAEPVPPPGNEPTPSTSTAPFPTDRVPTGSDGTPKECPATKARVAQGSCGGESTDPSSAEESDYLRSPEPFLK